MEKSIFSFVFLLLACFASAQPGIYDSKTRQPLPYLNVVVKSRKFFTSTNDQGRLETAGLKYGDTLTVNALNYDAQNVLYAPGLDSIFLKNVPIQLSELVIEKRRKEYVKTGFLEGKYPMQQNIEEPYIGKYYPPIDLYKSYPYLNKFKVKTFNTIKGQYINITLWEATKDGLPGKPIYDKNLIYKIGKGYKIVEVDLSKENVVIPQYGFFILFERVMMGDVNLDCPPNVTMYRNPDPKEPVNVCSMNPDGTGFIWADETPHTMAIELELSN
ncbi:MAG: hypothetical protein ACOVRN_04935 [Flavobacterium sp.]